MTTAPHASPDARELTPEHTLGEIVTRRPGAARVLERLGLDYCCGGARTLADACADADVSSAEVSSAEVLDAIEALQPEDTPDWASMGPAELVDHLEATHHRYLHAELPRLTPLAEKVASVHGDRHPELHDVRDDLAALRADLEPHLMKEERALFPMIRELATTDADAAPPEFHCGSLRNPISVLLAEHDTAGAMLERLRHRTAGYTVPDDGCASYLALYEGLAELEADTHLHVHKENNLLFPAVIALEERTHEGGGVGR